MLASGGGGRIARGELELLERVRTVRGRRVITAGVWGRREELLQGN